MKMYIARLLPEEHSLCAPRTCKFPAARAAGDIREISVSFRVG